MWVEMRGRIGLLGSLSSDYRSETGETEWIEKRIDSNSEGRIVGSLVLIEMSKDDI